MSKTDTTTRVAWNRSRDNAVTSKCGLWRITPRHIGFTFSTGVIYFVERLTAAGEWVRLSDQINTQAEAKAAVAEVVR